jgi:dolichol kinase
MDDSYRIEIVRKAIHLSSLSIPIFYLFTSKATALAVYVPLTLAVLAVDIARYYHAGVRKWFDSSWGWMLRKHEASDGGKQLSGASYVLISATVCIMVFPKIITISAFTILIISDMAAALIGKRYGRRPFLGKSIVGSSAFFISALAVIALTPKVSYAPAEYLIGAIAATVGTVVEALPLPIDDNLSIPMSVGITMWLLYATVLPGLNISILG